MPISLRFPITLVLSFVCLAVPAWADYQAGLDAYRSGDYATALREWRPLAEQGDADAQSILGLLYDTGRGVPQDSVQARQWFEKAAAQRVAVAQYGLGRLYFNGQGVPQDYTKARQWHEKAAIQGDSHAQTNLGLLYYEGQGVPQDFNRPCYGFVCSQIKEMLMVKPCLAACTTKGRACRSIMFRPISGTTWGQRMGKSWELRLVTSSPNR